MSEQLGQDSGPEFRARTPEQTDAKIKRITEKILERTGVLDPVKSAEGFNSLDLTEVPNGRVEYSPLIRAQSFEVKKDHGRIELSMRKPNEGRSTMFTGSQDVERQYFPNTTVETDIATEQERRSMAAEVLGTIRTAINEKEAQQELKKAA